MASIRGIGQRCYADFLMPPRFQVYEQFLQTAVTQNYVIHSVASFWRLLQQHALSPTQRYLILRHDIDTDPKAAARFCEIEQKFNAPASYYFRLATLDMPLMQTIAQTGAEVSYHYEEIAAIAKERGLKTRTQVEAALPAIRTRFAENLTQLRKLTGLPMTTVASHGDFINRRLQINNWEILQDAQLRQTLGIQLETYDPALIQQVSSYHSDQRYPYFWQPTSPFAALTRKEHVVCVLTHPRHWRSNLSVNLVDNFQRLWEEIFYRSR